MVKTKRKIVSVEPITDIAKNRFDLYMNGLHSCYVDDENDYSMYLTSINKKYKFNMSKIGDLNWRVVK
jgi:hypothetical protein